MQDPHGAQGHSIQKGQGKQGRPGKKTLRQEAVRIRRTNQAHLQKEGQNHQENHPQIVVQQVQEKEMYRRRQSQVSGPHGDQGNQKEKGR